MALINKLSDIAEAVRERSGINQSLTLEEMALEIKAIPYPKVESIAITSNGTFTPPVGVDGYNEISVEVAGGGLTPSEEVKF
jgi:hypothetical protein